MVRSFKDRTPTEGHMKAPVAASGHIDQFALIQVGQDLEEIATARMIDPIVAGQGIGNNSTLLRHEKLINLLSTSLRFQVRNDAENAYMLGVHPASPRLFALRQFPYTLAYPSQPALYVHLICSKRF